MEIQQTGDLIPRARVSKYAPLLTLKQGESVLVTKDEYQAAYQHCRNHNVKIAARSEGVNHYRIWKVQNV